MKQQLISPDINTDDGSCEYEVVLGCTDDEAVNYNDEAANDDGSCLYYVQVRNACRGPTHEYKWKRMGIFNLGFLLLAVLKTGTLETGFDGVNYYCLSNDYLLIYCSRIW